MSKLNIVLKKGLIMLEPVTRRWFAANINISNKVPPPASWLASGVCSPLASSRSTGRHSDSRCRTTMVNRENPTSSPCLQVSSSRLPWATQSTPSSSPPTWSSSATRPSRKPTPATCSSAVSPLPTRRTACRTRRTTEAAAAAPWLQSCHWWLFSKISSHSEASSDFFCFVSGS